MKRTCASNEEFTESGYSSLLDAMKRQYSIVSYDAPLQVGPIIFFRHDCDLSLNRALRIAEIEAEHCIRSTYFLLPHCSFYNLLERSQADLVSKIIGLGHDIGLHFDAGFYGLDDESQLDELVAEEASWLEKWFGQRPKAVSFHNPDEFVLRCERARYGGLVNCYSAHFKRNVGYCSDSNGYWRHERIIDVVSRPPRGPLQILTHPAWWQETPMHPRQRVLRCVEGRAARAIADYDDTLARSGRRNLAGPSQALREIADAAPGFISQIDRLWNAGHTDLAFLGLWRLLNEMETRATRQKSNVTFGRIAGSVLMGEAFELSFLEDACRELCELIAGTKSESHT